MKQAQKTFLVELGESMAKLLGPNCEVIIYDLGLPLKESILTAANGYITSNQVKHSIAQKATAALITDDDEATSVVFGQVINTEGGRILRSNSIVLRDETQQNMALISLNYDISDMMMAHSAIGTAIGVERDTMVLKPAEGHNDVVDLLDQLITESYEYIGKPVAMMSKKDKIEAIQFLAERGAFLIKKAGDKIANFYGISKYTLYNYLGSE